MVKSNTVFKVIATANCFFFVVVKIGTFILVEVMPKHPTNEDWTSGFVDTASERKAKRK